MNKKTYMRPEFETHKMLTEEIAAGSILSGGIPDVENKENEVNYPSGW